MSVKIYFSLNGLKRLFSNRFTVYVENNLVTEHSKVEFMPLRVKHLDNKSLMGFGYFLYLRREGVEEDDI